MKKTFVAMASSSSTPTLAHVALVCERCGHDATTKSNLLQHLRKKKACATTNSKRTREVIINELLKKENNDLPHKCEYCGNGLSSAPSKCQHKKVCRYRPDNLPSVVKEIEESVKHIQAQCQSFENMMNVLTNNTDMIMKQYNMFEKWVGCKMFNEENKCDDDEWDEVKDEQDVSNVVPSQNISQLYGYTLKTSKKTKLIKKRHRIQFSKCPFQTTTEDIHHNITKSLEDRMLSSVLKVFPIMLDNTLKKYELRIVQLQKKSKQKITPRVRRQVWNTHIGETTGVSKCMCCEDIKITQHNFICGHVVAECNGGTLDIENLRPICAVCNDAMGQENMNEYKIAKFGLCFR